MKLNTKTITLTGTEQEIRLSGQNCDIRNDGTDTVYASGEPNITAGADGVMSLPAGQAVQIRGFGGVMYLLGTGSVQICGHDFQTPVFKCAPAGGGSGTTDQTARDTINAHANNTDIHLTAEKTIEAAATAISNPNLLINPDFKINQRGQTEYEANGYSVDMWFIGGGEKVTVVSGGLKVECTNTIGRAFRQTVEIPEYMVGQPFTLSVNVVEKSGRVVATVNDVNSEISGIGIHKYTFTPTTAELQIQPIRPVDVGASATVAWAKLEFGSVATPFTPPDPATELLKCQRYFVRLDNDSTRNFSYNGSGFVVSATQVQVVCSLPAPMRLAEPSVTMSEAPCTVFTASKGINSLYETTIAQASAAAGNGIVVLFTIADGVTGDPAQLVFKNKAGQYFDFSAEL